MEPSVDFFKVAPARCRLDDWTCNDSVNGLWFGFVIASSVGVLAGLWCGLHLFSFNDVLTNVYAPYALAIETLISLLVSLVTALARRKLPVSNKRFRLAAWLVFLCCVAFGQVAIAWTPRLVAHRVPHNDRTAAVD